MNTRHIRKISLASDVETKVNASANSNSTEMLDKHMADYPIDGNYDVSTYLPHIQPSERTAYDAVVDEAVRTTNVTQSIAGAKTFTGTVTVPAPTSNNQAATKKYVDDAIAASGGGGTWATLSSFTDMLSSDPDTGLFEVSSSRYYAKYDVEISVTFRYGSGNLTYHSFFIPKGSVAPVMLCSIGSFSAGGTSSSAGTAFTVTEIPFDAIPTIETSSVSNMAVAVHRTTGITIHTTSYDSTNPVSGTDALTAYIASSPLAAGTGSKRLYVCVRYRR